MAEESKAKRSWCSGLAIIFGVLALLLIMRVEPTYAVASAGRVFDLMVLPPVPGAVAILLGVIAYRRKERARLLGLVGAILGGAAVAFSVAFWVTWCLRRVMHRGPWEA